MKLANISIYEAFERFWVHVTTKISDMLSSIQTLLNDKMDQTAPTGTGAFSLNRLADSTVGKMSFAEGANCTASASAAHAEGLYTTASGNYSHAEGWNSTASGPNAHAEGMGTVASGTSSHTEGEETTASGYGSHTEGGYTTASGDYQHVQGKYNVVETAYAHIVGNGSGTTPSNAHTLDWDGNAWYQGDVYVGSTSGTNRDEGSKKLATEEWVQAQIEAAIGAVLNGAS